VLKKKLANNLIDGEEGGHDVDFANLRKLFIEYKNQVITYGDEENEIEGFMQNHSQYFNDSENLLKNHGIIFVKILKSAS
jgi:hypothetical protein